MREFSYIITGPLFLILCALGLGRQLVQTTLPTPYLIMGAIGTSFFTAAILLILAASIAARHGKPWGLNALRFFTKTSRVESR